MSWILHSDINNCYASIELVFRPELRNKPVVVGGDEESRHGIVLAKNMIAKKCGIKTGSALVEARSCCPGLVSLPPNYPLYLKYAKLVRAIYADYTDKQEAFGIDESWLDISPIAKTTHDVTLIANEMRARIRKELGVTVSVGASWNKIYAKLGSDYRKPDALTVFDRDNYKGLVYPLPAADLLYVGPSTKKKLRDRNICTIGDIVEAGPERMTRRLGKVGEMLWGFASGRDVTPVAHTGEGSVIKSIGNSSTFPRDLTDNDDIKMAFFMLSESVAARLRENGFEAKTVQIYLRSNDLSGFERQKKLQRPTFITSDLVDAAMQLFSKNYSWQRPLRSVGIRAADLVPIGTDAQLSMFEDEGRRDRREKLEYASDFIRGRYGYFALQRGILLRDPKLTALDAKKENIIHPISYQPVKGSSYVQ